MSQAEVQNLMDQLNGICGACALLDWNNWTTPDVNLLLIHSMECTGCNSYCECMKDFWNHVFSCSIADPTENCPDCKAVITVFQFHMKSCSRVECKVPRCSEMRTLLDSLKFESGCTKLSDKIDELMGTQTLFF